MIERLSSVVENRIPVFPAITKIGPFTAEEIAAVDKMFDDARIRAIEDEIDKGYPRVSPDYDVQEFYLFMRLHGESHNMAEILALRKFPATRTDVDWNRGHVNGNQFDGPEPVRLLGDYYRRIAERNGVNVTGKVYKSGLAEFPGDPRAWVSSRGEAESVVRERGWSSTGLVNVKPAINDAAPDPGPVDPRLIANEVAVRRDTGNMLGCKDEAELSDKLMKLRAWKPDHEIGVVEDDHVPDL